MAPMASAHIPARVRDRRWWLLPLAIWAFAVGLSLWQHLNALHQQGVQIASEGARNLFNMVLLTRAWNAGHGGVYVPVSDKAQPNPWLKHPRRDLTSTDGLRLTMINPAYMTRQIAELAQAQAGTRFHITSLLPIRPANAPDPWERKALASFERGVKEVIALQPDKAGASQLRYMAPLLVQPPCLTCHAVQGYKIGQVRGGISVTQPFDPIHAASDGNRMDSWIKHIVIFLLVSLAGGALLELLRRRWHELSDNLEYLETASQALRSANAELAQARDLAESASRGKSAFLSAMSHELRTPLNGILGFAHLLQRADLPDKAREQACRIGEQGNRLLGLVDDVMEFTRLETLDRPAQEGVVDMRSITRALSEELNRKCEAKGLSAVVAVSPSLPNRVSGDRTFLLGCLRPLLENAVKFTEAGEIAFRIEITHREEDRLTIQVTVSDTGIGIDEADREKLFQPFRQLDERASRRYGGLGLGLALAARYASLLGGRLDYTPLGGGGSQFTLNWPTREAASEINPSSIGCADRVVWLSQLENLLADDDMEAASLLAGATPELAHLFPREEWALLREEVASFDYPAALQRLRRLLG
jgi:signal transduction histidine kinase